MQRLLLGGRHGPYFIPSSSMRMLNSSVSLMKSLSISHHHHHRHICRFIATNNNENNNNNNNNNGNGVTLPRSAFPPSDFPERSLLKCIEKEIQDETLRLDKEDGPPPPPPGWEMYHAPGTSFFYGRCWWVPPTPVHTHADGGVQIATKPRVVERHTIRVQLTTRDPSLDPECDVRGEHFPFSLFVQRVEGTSSTTSLSHVRKGTEKNDGEENICGDEEEERGLYDQSIEVRADFVEGELIVDNVVFHGSYKTARKSRANSPTGAGNNNNNNNNEGEDEKEKEVEVHYNNIFGGYPGPNLDEVEEEVLDGIQAWLAERRIDDQFGEFVAQYSVWVEQMEYERWLRQLRDFVAA